MFGQGNKNILPFGCIQLFEWTEAPIWAFVLFIVFFFS